MLICLTGYCMAKSGFDRTITQPPKLFQLRKLEIQQSLRIDSTVYLIYWWWFPTPVVRCAVSHNSDVPKVTPYFVCKLLFMGIASFYTLLRNNRINWNVQCWSMLKLILSQGSKRDSLVQPGDFPGEVPREKACAMTCKRADAELSVVRVGHLATAFWNWARWDTMGYHGIPWDTDTVPWDTDHGWFRDLWAQILRWFHDVSNQSAQILRWFHDVSSQSDESIRLPWPVMVVWWHLLKIYLKSAKKCLLCWHCAWEDCFGFEDLNG